VMASLLIVALISNRMMRPVHANHHVQNSHSHWWQNQKENKAGSTTAE